jgi:hypothetical protein
VPTLNPDPEHRPKTKTAGIVSDLCNLLSEEDSKRIVVVCEHPQTFESAASKEWRREIRSLRSHLADESRGMERTLTESDIAIKESITFAAAPLINSEADVMFATASQLENKPPRCDIMIITPPVNEGLIEKLTRNIRRNGQIVMYG